MAKLIKQWLMVNDEIYRTEDNAKRYYAFLTSSTTQSEC